MGVGYNKDNHDHQWRWQPGRGRWACYYCKDFWHQLPPEGIIDLDHKPTRKFLLKMIDYGYRYEDLDR